MMIRDWYESAEGNKPVITISISVNIVSGEVLLIIADKSVIKFHLGTKLDFFMEGNKKN